MLALQFEKKAVRVVGTRERPEWVAADVCAVLGVGAPANLLRVFDGDEKGMCSIHTPSGDQDVLTVTEPGLYRLIMRSRKPTAKAFRRWVCHEVLPCIRQHGCYPPPPPPPPMLGTALSGPETAVLGPGIDYEDLIPLERARSLKWLPKKVSFSTIWGWGNAGIYGVKLEIRRVGGVLATSDAAMRRFVAAVSQKQQKTGKGRKPSESHLRACAHLDAMGVGGGTTKAKLLPKGGR